MAQKPDIQYIRFYTEGSAARQVAPLSSVKKALLPKPRKLKRRNLYIDPVATLGIAVAVCMLVLMAVGIFRFRAAQQETLAMEQYVQQLNLENQTLTDSYEAGFDLAEIEKTAMALGMIPKEEVQQVTIQLSAPAAEEPVGVWERIGMFLTGLFA